MQQAQPIVIVDRNGTEHEFPAGFDPKKAAEIVRTQLDAGQQPVSGTAPAPGLAERFLGFFGMQPSEKFEQYRDMLNSGGSLDDVIKRAEASEQRNGGVLRKADRDALPYVGGTVGGVMGGAPGATLGGAAGEAFKQIDDRLAGSNDAPSTSMDAAKGIALEGGVQGALEAGGNLLVKGLEKGAHAVYRGYLKPSLAKNERAKAKEIVATALREGLPISEGGSMRARTLIDNINHQVNRELASAGPHQQVDLHRVATRVREMAQRRYGGKGAPKEDFDAVMKVADEIDRHWSLNLPENVRPTRLPVPPTEANATKQRLDRAIGDTGFGAERNAGTEARKVGRHAARTEIERAVPGVKPLNEREARIIDVLDQLEGAVGRLGNTDKLMGVRTIGAGLFGAGAMSGGDDPASALVQAVVLRGLVSPNVASRAAILASRFAKVPGTAPALAARMGLILAQRESDEQAK